MATSLPPTMRAWRYASVPNSDLPSALTLDSVPLPPKPLTPSSVLIKIRAASLNPADHKVPELPALIARRVIPVPATPGMDFAGVVASLGSAVADFQVGQSVYGRVHPDSFGSLAEYVVIDLKTAALAPLPEGVSFADASCIGTAGQTAYQLIAPYIKAGDSVFVNGGSGGVGTFAIQVAKSLGCTVVTSCSARNASFCASLGADEVLDYTAQDVSAALKSKGQIFSLVFDCVGHSPADLYQAADVYLKDGGRFVQIGGEVSLEALRSTMSRLIVPSWFGGGKRKLEMPMTKNVSSDLEAVGELVREGKVKVVIDETFPFDETPEAYVQLKTGRARGKIVVTMP